MSNYVALAPLAISVLSFSTSVYFGLLDRVRIKAVSKLYNMDPEFGPPYLEVKVVNHGRRVAILTMFGGKLDNGEWICTHIGEPMGRSSDYKFLMPLFLTHNIFRELRDIHK